MSNSNVGTRPPGYPDDWVVTRVGRRAVWNGGEKQCANCGTTIDLDQRHYYAELAHDVDMQGQRLRSETRQAVFCTRTCLDEWFAEY